MRTMFRGKLYFDKLKAYARFTKYVIIAENDESDWIDKTGEHYHFPNRYRKILVPGAEVIYYKGKLRSPRFKTKRLTPEAHYFATGRISEIFPDPKSSKQDWFAGISDFRQFSKPVVSKIDGKFLETIPDNRKKNYWRDGVRLIDSITFQNIISLSDVKFGLSIFTDNDENINNENNFKLEGALKQRFITTYERNPITRQQALLIHGYECLACGFNFEKVYGEFGKGFIEIHHIQPISGTGEKAVNPKTDLIPLCSNCHSMVHRQRGKTLTIDELRDFLLRRK